MFRANVSNLSPPCARRERDLSGRQDSAMGPLSMVGPGASNVQRNRILSGMSNADLALLQLHLERVPLKLRQRLQPANRQIRNVYFLETGIAPSSR
jgi:hypothetical protein